LYTKDADKNAKMKVDMEIFAKFPSYFGLYLAKDE
jgi:hypothetical protein